MVCFLYKINEIINTIQMKIIFTKLLFRRAGEIARMDTIVNTIPKFESVLLLFFKLFLLFIVMYFQWFAILIGTYSCTKLSLVH